MYDIYDNDFDKAFDEAVDAIEKKEHRLIWADALKRHYAWWKGGGREMTMDEAKSDFDTIIDLQPTVDVVPAEDYRSMEQTVYKLTQALAEAEPVKHGKWVLNERGVYQCECGFVPTMEEKIYYNYCPHCGAKMDQVGLTTSAELHPEKYLENLNEVKE